MTILEEISKLIDIIEQRKLEKLTVDLLSDEIYLSVSHLQKLFRQVTGQALMDYVRGRKLAYSLELLLNSELRVIDIAQECGFAHEQSYARAFKAEYGCAPGVARKEKRVLPIRERIVTDHLYTIGQGLMVEPKIVVVPGFFAVGKLYSLPNFSDKRDALVPNQYGLDFVRNDMKYISNAVSEEIYYGLNRVVPGEVRINEYMPSLQVADLMHIPTGFHGEKFPTSLCARFRYIGQHHVEEINMVTARDMYSSITYYFKNQKRYMPKYQSLFFEKIDSRLCDDTFCQMEWFIQVLDTSSM